MNERNYITSYQKIVDCDEELSEVASIYNVAKSSKTKWNHIKNLDSFLKNIYNYHQDGGFWHRFTKDVVDLLTTLFTALVTIVSFELFNYFILQKKLPPGHDFTRKISVSEIVANSEEFFENFSVFSKTCLIISFMILIFRVILIIKNWIRYWEIKQFFREALGIQDRDVQDVTWEEVKLLTMEAQATFRMCVNKNFLSELDLYHRILRFENYFISMVQRKVIAFNFKIPYFGEIYFAPPSLQFLLKRLLFDHNFGGAFKKWYLKEEYKHAENRAFLAEKLSLKFFHVGWFCLVISPITWIIQVFHTVYCYFAFLRLNPSFFAIKVWSNYAKVSLRHYNELDHELNARLSRSYKFAEQYMNCHSSLLTASIVLPLSYITSIMSLVCFMFSLFDSEIFDVDYMLPRAAGLAIVAHGLRRCVPIKNEYYCPKMLMTNICKELHNLPDIWKEKAHTSYVRNEFSNFFKCTFNHIFELLFSPIITPFIFMFKMREKSLEIIDFLRYFTVEVPGVGDVCSFALMDIGKHENHTWHPVKPSVESARPEYSPPNVIDNDKTEPLLHNFSFNNPNSKPPQNSESFFYADLVSLGPVINEGVFKDNDKNLPKQTEAVNTLYSQQKPGSLYDFNNCTDNSNLFHDVLYLDNLTGWKKNPTPTYVSGSSYYNSSGPPSLHGLDDDKL
ncbi:Autophagy-related protein 9 [Armadillidium nasatum]|uniref:Autophagy-related protein 9 n=1 Tax=Armadillidium nasatum TaxID=96803 RepID=A0A5N5T9P7_9CRUS|nr:Autophagy-related protein 9 [Armadillidium nasatum]